MTVTRSTALIALALALCAGRVDAQSGGQSDVTGPPVTSGDIVGGMFIPTGPTSIGAMDFLRAPAASAYASAALRLEAQLRAGALTAFKDASTTIRIPESTQRNLLNLVRGIDCKGAEDSLVHALLQYENLANSYAGTPDAIARRLAHSLCDLTSRAATVDPTRQNTFAAGQIQEAVAAYNAVIDNSNEVFLLSPPPELLAIGSALATLVNDAWNATPSSTVARAPSRESALAPSPPKYTAATPGTAGITLCVVDPSIKGGLKSVDALQNLSNGDTTIVVNGSTVALSSTLPRVPVLEEALWFQRGRPLEVGTNEKIQFTQMGLARVIDVSSLNFLGTVNGLPVYTDRSSMSAVAEMDAGADLTAMVDQNPAVRKLLAEKLAMVYVPLRQTGCLFQPMQRVEQVRKPRE